MGKKDKTEETPPESVVEAAQEGIPFVGDITRYLFGEAPDAIRKAIEGAGKDEILSKSYPYREEMKKKDYEAHMERLQVELVKMLSAIETVRVQDRANALRKNLEEVEKGMMGVLAAKVPEMGDDEGVTTEVLPAALYGVRVTLEFMNKALIVRSQALDAVLELAEGMTKVVLDKIKQANTFRRNTSR